MLFSIRVICFPPFLHEVAYLFGFLPKTKATRDVIVLFACICCVGKNTSGPVTPYPPNPSSASYPLRTRQRTVILNFRRVCHFHTLTISALDSTTGSSSYAKIPWGFCVSSPWLGSFPECPLSMLPDFRWNPALEDRVNCSQVFASTLNSCWCVLLPKHGMVMTLSVYTTALQRRESI